MSQGFDLSHSFCYVLPIILTYHGYFYFIPNFSSVFFVFLEDKGFRIAGKLLSNDQPGYSLISADCV